MTWPHLLAGVFIVTGPWAVYLLDRARRHVTARRTDRHR